MTIIITFEPTWGTGPTVAALTGLTLGKIRELVKAGHVRARKENPESRTSRIVFRVSDINEWLEHEALPPKAQGFQPRKRANIAALAPLTTTWKTGKTS